jgi:hypothetical protein
MKIPTKGSRGRTVLLSMCSGPVTLHQGIERHGELGVGIGTMRRVYQQLVMDGCATAAGLVYTINPRAQAILVPPVVCEDGPEPVAAGPRYQTDWRSSSLNAASARMRGAAYGFREVRLQSGGL